MTRVIYFLAVLLAASLRSYAQTDSTFLPRLTTSLNASSKKNPVEKVHLQLDKPYYAAGDDIWFKAYLTTGSKHELSDISGVLYVELINSKRTIEQYIKLPLASGLTWGDFKLPDSIKAGNYRIRAYTNWMRNAGPEYFYDKTIYIVNSITPVPPPLSTRQQKKKIQQQLVGRAAPSKIDLQFFPESGNLVYGINSLIAFKAVGEDGLGKDVKGFISDDQNQQVTTFSSAHLGMGIFSMMPIEGHTYKACITYPDGAEKTVQLPVPVSKGFVSHIDNTDSLLVKIDIEASPDLINKDEGVYLVAQSGGSVCFAAKSKSISSSFTAAIPKSKFQTGIVQFTLFSASGEPLNERLVFIRHNDQLNMSFASQKNSYAVRGKAKFELSAKAGEGKTSPGNFSVAVIDASTIPADENENTIFSNLLLTSDLKGYIEKPAYYFAADNAETRQNLDVLMLTQGYRRFGWKQVLGGELPDAVYKPETSLQVTGHITTLGGRPLDHAKVSLMSTSKGFLMMDTVSDKDGHFVFDKLQFGDSIKFVVQSKSKKDSKNVQIGLDTVRPAAVIPAIVSLPAKIDTPAGLTVMADKSKKVYDQEVKFGLGNHKRALKEVKITAIKKMPNSSNLNGPGNADQVILWKDLHGGCGDIASCLMGRVNKIIIKWDPLNWYYYPCAYRNGQLYKLKIKVDGMDMDAEYLMTLSPQAVESVEVLMSPQYTSVYGQDGYNGLLLINMKKGVDAIPLTNIATITPKGYYKAREFYSPKYDDPNTNTVLADLRSTIYWNPNLVTDKDGKVSFEYFNAGNKGNYRVIVEGIDANGRLGRYVYNYNVE